MGNGRLRPHGEECVAQHPKTAHQLVGPPPPPPPQKIKIGAFGLLLLGAPLFTGKLPQFC